MQYSDHRHLDLIAQRIAELERQINSHRRIVADLDEVGRGNCETAEIARDTLRILQRNLQHQIRDQKRTRARMRG